MDDIVRLTIFITDIADDKAVGGGAGQGLQAAGDVDAWSAIKALVLPELKVEIEATAVVTDGK